MSEKTRKNIGCSIFLENVPIKYEMEPANILISESQERMLIVCKKENIEKKIEELTDLHGDDFNSWSTEAYDEWIDLKNQL